MLVGFHGYAERRRADARGAACASAASGRGCSSASRRSIASTTAASDGRRQLDDARGSRAGDCRQHRLRRRRASRRCGAITRRPATLVYAGFSQGVAMAYRAAAFVARTPPPRGVIVLAGDVPPDVVPLAGLAAARADRPRHRPMHWYTGAEGRRRSPPTVAWPASHPPSTCSRRATSGTPSFVARAGQFLDTIDRRS